MNAYPSRRTKIVATLGPATDTPEALRALIGAGMDVARLNFSHGTHAEHARRVAMVRAEAARACRSVGILMDLQGPKIRTGPLVGDQPVELRTGQRITITTAPVEGTAERVSTTYEALPHDVHAGDRVLVSDGLIELRVLEASGSEVACEVVYGGTLRAHQGINLPGVQVSASSLTPKDAEDLRFGLSEGVDYVALSFVRQPSDVVSLKDLIASLGANTPVISKLEKPEALDHLDGILAVSDGVMVARGDLGVEMPPERVPAAQKSIIRAANRAAIPVITATQMLESMITSPQPTRAEVSDVANAILDGSDAVMLSGETAIGRYPLRAVEFMARIAADIEACAARDRELRPPTDEQFAQARSIPQAVGAAVGAIGRALPVRALCVVTRTGSSARLVSHYRPAAPILAFTPAAETYQRLSLLWGVQPIRTAFVNSEEDYYRQVQYILIDRGYANVGDTVVVTGGHPIVQGGPTNFIKILVVADDRA
jgi:pyruvate kinase